MSSTWLSVVKVWKINWFWGFINRHVAFILILCHCIVVLFELCIDNNQIQIFFFFFACHPGLF